MSIPKPVNVNRDRMRRFVEESLAGLLEPFVKKLATPKTLDVIRTEVVRLLQRSDGAEKVIADIAVEVEVDARGFVLVNIIPQTDAAREWLRTAVL